MNEIRELTSKFCLNVSSDPRLLQETIRQSFKDLCSLSKQMKSLADYGPILMSRKLFEPVSPGGSSPCHSDNCLDDDEEKSRIVEPSLYEAAEIFLDTSAIIEISQTAQSSNWCLWIMISGLHDESAIKGLLALIEKHVPNVHYETCRKVVYKGQISFVLHFKEHFTTQKVFTFLKEDFYAKTYIKERWQIFKFYNRMDDPKYMSQFFGVILQNLPLDCTSQTIIDLVAMHSSNISVLSVEIPALIGDSFCSLIRTKTLEDAEMLALTLNGLITQTGNIRAGLHPSCNFKHQSFDKDPFKDIKIDHSKKPETGKETKNDIKSLLSLFKSELKVSKRPVPISTQKVPENSMTPNNIPFKEGQRMMLPHQTFPPHHPQQFPSMPMPGPSFAYNGPPPVHHNQQQQVFPSNPRNPAMFFGHPQRWVPPDYNKPADYYHPPAKFPQKFGRKIQKTFLKPTRASNNSKRIAQAARISKKQITKTDEAEKTEIPQFTSPKPEQTKKELTSPSLVQNPKRSFVESVQNGNKQNLEKVFEKKLSDWSIGVYQIKSSTLLEKKIESVSKSHSLSISNWKITSGISSNQKRTSTTNNKLPFYLENMMDEMINPVKAKKPSRFSDKIESSSINTKRKFESLYPDKDDKIQKLKNNIQEFQKKSDEIGDNLSRFQRFNKSQVKQDSLLSSSDEEKELELGPQKKQYLDTFTKEIPNYGELPQKEEKKLNLDSLGWSIKSSNSNKRDLTPPLAKNQNSKRETQKANIPSPKSTNSNETKQIPVTPKAGPTNIVFNGPYVQSSNLNYMYLPPGMAYPHVLMNPNQHHNQTPVMPNSFSFNPQMMVYHNNFILNPLAPCHNGQHQPFWNIPMPHPQESARNILQTNSPKKLKDWTPPLKARGNLPPAKNKANEGHPEPQLTPPLFPSQEIQQGGGIEHCD